MEADKGAFTVVQGNGGIEQAEPVRALPVGW